MFAARLASLAVRRPGALIAAAILLAVIATILFQSRQAFDSEILNLLPSDEASVQGLKIYNARFNSARELAFLVETPVGGDPEITEEFVEALGRQPWVLRMLDAPPVESQKGRETLPALASPLILGQEETEFDTTVEKLDPNVLRSRLKNLVAKALAGSPLARIELQNDPTGLIAPVAEKLSRQLSINEQFDLITPDGRARILPVIADLPDLSAEDCRNLMGKVRAFVGEFSGRPGAPRIFVTGRSAYVDEISRSMHRDIAVTGLVSIAVVTLLFWFSFRSLVPLVGSVLILAWSCLIALACGSMIFDRMNVVAMGFCSILVGLGDDFSLLLYQRYVRARAMGLTREKAIADSTRHGLPGIFWVGITTSLGFASLVFSGSAGFAQLGILIAIGVLAGALGMIFFMPLFEREIPMRSGDPVLALCLRILHSGWTFRLGSLLLAGAFLLAVLPWRSLRFDTSTHSLEPKQIPAAKALARIMELFPATFEPVMIIVPGSAGPSSLRTLDAKLEELKNRGLIEKYSTPSALVPDPEQLSRNLARLQSLDWDGLETVVNDVTCGTGLRAGSLDPATQLFRHLQSRSPLSEQLPPLSPWWFALDRVLAPTTGDVVYYVRLPEAANFAARQELERAILDALPEALITGWTQMLNDMVPWATRELLVFGGAVVGVILLTLLFTYRNLRILVLHVATLLLALGGTVATLKFLGHSLNILNVLAFPLILAVGVDYGVHLILAMREEGDVSANLPAVMKPVLISALTTITGFGALTLARNPALNGLGVVCATGVAWCLVASFLFLAPLCLRPGLFLRRGAGASPPQ
ncbi:MAG: MMPL family transporter [Chthoniobacterales bacterium]|nr:MMPL family transporter [Chthoniobacterales bacterium]